MVGRAYLSRARNRRARRKQMTEHYAEVRPLLYAIAREWIDDKSLWDDCVQEGIIRIWQIESEGIPRSNAYLHKAARRRMREVAGTQLFFGHLEMIGDSCSAWMPRAKQRCARQFGHGRGGHMTAKALKRVGGREFHLVDPLRQKHSSLNRIYEEFGYEPAYQMF
jgi:hypothetical protein